MDRYRRSLCFTREMVKFAGHSLISSFTPFHSFVLKKHSRLTVNKCCKSSANSRIVPTFVPSNLQYSKAEMVALRYKPPLFRWVMNASLL